MAARWIAGGVVGDAGVLTAIGTEAGRERLFMVTGRLAGVVATVWIAWVLAGLAWLAGGHSPARLLPPPARQARAAPVAEGKLAALNLFGLPPAAPATGAAVNAPDTSLQLRLAGVFVNSDPARSSAIVAERTAPAARLYQINEALPGGATLVSVYDDRILIRRGAGTTEVLRFEKTGLLDGKPAGADSGMPVSASLPGPRQLLANAVTALATAPDEFIRQMGLKQTGQGYEITGATPENLRSAVGLQPGDRIVSVNGRMLGDPQRDRDVLMALKNGGTARVVIQRGNQTLTFERKF